MTNDLAHIKSLLAGMPELEAIRRDDPRGQPVAYYRALQMELAQ